MLAVAACSATEPEPPGERLRSSLARNAAPNPAPADAAALTAGNTDFALALHGRLRNEPGNLVHAPLSVSLALAMTYAGARGDTERQMAAALRYSLPQADLHNAYNRLDLELGRRGQGATAADGGPFRLRIVNALFAQQGYSFLPAFLDALAVNYDAGVSLLDFEQAPELARASINQWISHLTEQKVPELLPRGTITGATRLVLANAIYFNAAWKHAFPAAMTEAADFTTLNGVVRADLMRVQASFEFARTDTFEAIVMPYDGEELEMLVVVPTAGTFEAFEAALDRTVLDGVVAALAPNELDLAFPKLELRSKAGLVPHLQALGMSDAFTDRADFSGMDGGRRLQIADVQQEAYVLVNEAGTEGAAASSGSEVAISRVIFEPVTVDHPFLFFIRDRPTGTILFVGRVVDPTR